MWSIGGWIEIERIAGTVGELMRLPFTITWPGEEQPPLEWVIEQARNIANEFLNLVGPNDSLRRDYFGNIGNVEVAFATFHF